MSEIKVGDEVFVHGIALDHRNNPYPYSFNEIVEKISDCGQMLLISGCWCHIKHCEKTEPKPFVITPKDVGRFARTKDEKKALIGCLNCNGEYEGFIIGEYNNNWLSNGKDTLLNDSDDLVAWWDE